MAKRDVKNKFYRNLNLDKDTKKLISWYRRISEDMKKGKDDISNTDK